MFAIAMLSGFVLRAKQQNGESYTLYWNLKSSFSGIAPRERTWKEALRGEWNGKIASSVQKITWLKTRVSRYENSTDKLIWPQFH